MSHVLCPPPPLGGGDTPSLWWGGYTITLVYVPLGCGDTVACSQVFLKGHGEGGVHSRQNQFMTLICLLQVEMHKEKEISASMVQQMKAEKSSEETKLKQQLNELLAEKKIHEKELTILKEGGPGGAGGGPWALVERLQQEIDQLRESVCFLSRYKLSCFGGVKWQESPFAFILLTLGGMDQPRPEKMTPPPGF